MPGPGRPTKRSVERRKRQLLLFLVRSAHMSEEAVKRLALKLNLNERSIRNTLEALVTEFEVEEVPSRGLSAAIKAADSFKLLRLLSKRVSLAVKEHAIDSQTASVLLEAIREQRQLLHAEREDEGQAALGNLVPMTLDQVEQFLTWRESSARRPLAPGEPAPPPVEGEGA